MALARSGDVESALGLLGKALTLRPDPILRYTLLNEYAMLLIEIGRAEEARSLLLDQEIPLPADLPGAVLRKTLGLAQLSCGESEAAVETLGAALAGALPADLQAATLVSYGQALEATGRLQDAVLAFSGALVSPGDAQVEAAARAGLTRIQDAAGDGNSR
jgi:tetratricopeptide (TPR) repeat protein